MYTDKDIKKFTASLEDKDLEEEGLSSEAGVTYDDHRDSLTFILMELGVENDLTADVMYGRYGDYYSSMCWVCFPAEGFVAMVQEERNLILEAHKNG